MLTANPTKKGTGLELFGHLDDLKSLHDTVSYLSDSDILDSWNQEHALSIAYDIRKSYEGRREIRETDYGARFGTQYAWPHIIYYTSIFRNLAAHRPTNKEHQSNLSRLEHCLESALISYDAKVGREVIDLYAPVGALSKGFLTSYIDTITYDFLYESGSGKMRFRRLPALIRSMVPWSTEYRSYETELVSQARKLGCAPHLLEDSGEWLEIDW